MNSDRSQAYSSLIEYIRDIGPVKLLEGEQDRIRAAADTLVLAGTWDDESREAMEDMDRLADHLVESTRWELDSADRLVEAVRTCGPEIVPAGHFS